MVTQPDTAASPRPNSCVGFLPNLLISMTETTLAGISTAPDMKVFKKMSPERAPALRERP